MEENKNMLDRVAKILLYIIGAAWFICQINFSFFNPINPMTIAPIFLSFGLAIVYLIKPFPGSKKFPFLRLLDFAVLVLCVVISVYYFMEQERIITRIPHVSGVEGADIIVGLIVVILLLEGVRRVIGLNLLVFLLVFLVYCVAGPVLPGVLNFVGFNVDQFTEVMTLTNNGIFGTPLTTTASYIFYFVLFGSLFAACGGGQVLIDIGMRVSKPDGGGPAKAAVISSGLMGMVSGSAVANVTTTGVLTIPMMKKAGYEPEQAGAVEAVASTGGQIMPPIMGVGAFIMAELLGISYLGGAMAAIIPAVAYFGCAFLIVGFLAKKRHYLHPEKVVSKEELTFKTDPILPRLFLLLPAIVLVIMVMTGQSLRMSAIYSIIAILVLNFFNPKRLGPKAMFEAFMDGIQQCADIAIPVASCGIIIGVVVQSGLANKLASLVSSVGNGSLLPALLLTMICCLLLGMAMPTSAAYLISVTLFASALVRLDLPLICAHMFCFYFGVMAQITPPVCLASFTAAGIAKANSWKTGWTGFLYASVAILVPYAFAYEPALLLEGPMINTITAGISLFIGCYGLASAVAGFRVAPLNMPLRVVLAAGSICCIIPGTITDIIGIVVLVLVSLYGMQIKKLHQREVAA